MRGAALPPRIQPCKKWAMIDCGQIYRTFTGARTWDFALHGAKINRSVTRLRRAWFPCGTVSRLAGAHSSGCDWWRVAKIALSKSVNPHWGRWESKGLLATSAPAFVFAVRPSALVQVPVVSKQVFPYAEGQNNLLLPAGERPSTGGGGGRELILGYLLDPVRGCVLLKGWCLKYSGI